MYRTHLIEEIKPEMEGKEVIIAGWVHTKRDLGGKKFLIIRDMSGIGQVVLSKRESPQEHLEIFDKLTRESVVSIRGIVKLDRRAPRGYEIIPLEIRVHSIAKAPLPLDVTGAVPADIDTRLNARVLDLRREEMKAVFKIQDTTLKTIRETLYELGFIEVLTPKIIASATEGGAQLFPVLYFGREAFLAQSPQLYKEMLAGAFERVFEIGPAYRAEESDTPYHLSEFISVDIEMAFANYHDVMKVLENVVYNVIEAIRKERSRELEVLGYELPKVSIPFKRVTYDEAIRMLKESNYPIEYGEDFGTPEQRALGELIGGFYFIIEWPTAIKPFYSKPRDDNPEISETFDLMYEWLEIASGGTRIHSKKLLEEQLRRQGLNPKNFEYFLKWFDYGMPPHAGWGMGLSRLMLILTGKRNIREVVLFPRDKKRLEP